MRTRKAPAARREEIIDAALQRFSANGITATTVSDIAKSAGVSKGGFYHHFATKAALLDATMDPLAAQAGAFLDAIAHDDTLSPTLKLRAFFKQNRRTKEESVGSQRLALLGAVLAHEANASFRAAWQRRSIDQTLPYLTAILQSGRKCGAFHVKRPAALARDILLFGAALTDDALHTDPAHIDVRLRRFRRYVAMLLGLPPNSL